MKCSECGSHNLVEIGETHSLNLYDHRDRRFQCQECGEIRVYGKGADERESFSLYVLPTGATELVARPPVCPDHDELMAPTKIRPDEGDHGVVQFKCRARDDAGDPCELIGSRELEPI